MVKDNHLSLGTLNGRIKIPYTDDPSLPLDKHVLGTATLVHKHGKWMLHVPITINIDEYAIGLVFFVAAHVECQVANKKNAY